MRRSYPNPDYYLALAALRAGELRDATRAAIDARQSLRRDLAGLWLDSTPVFAVLGECAFQAGNLPEAHVQFEQAITVALQRRGWLQAVNWPIGDVPAMLSVPTTRIPAAAQQSGQRRADLPDVFKVSMGDTDISSVLQQGGAFQTPHVLLVDVPEIVRGLGWAIYRRGELLGFGRQTDPLLDDFLRDLRGQPLSGSPLHRVCVQTLIGLAANARGDAKAGSVLEGAAYLPGQLEHPLTALVCLGIARGAAEAGNADLAAKWAWQSAGAAARWEQAEFVVPALQIAMAPALSQADASVQAQAMDMAVFYERISPLISVYAYGLAAEAASIAGQVNDGANLLARAEQLMRNRNRRIPRAEWHLAYVSAMQLAANGRGDVAWQRLQEPLRAMQGLGGQPVGSAAAFQLRLALDAINKGALGPRSIEQVAGELLLDPSPRMWMFEPLDAWAMLASDLESLERLRVQVAFERQQPLSILWYADAAQRRHAWQVLPWFGRATGMRWLVSWSARQLPEEAVAVQQFALAGPLAGAGKALQQALAEQADVARDPLRASDAQRTALRTSAQTADALLNPWILRRQSWPRVFPPPLASSEQQQAPKPPPDQAIIAFCPGKDQLFGISLSAAGLHTWPIARSETLTADIASLLETIGVGRKRAGASRLPAGTADQELARKIFQRLFPDSERSLLNEVEEVVIVPWGPLWNLPFELFRDVGQDKPLIERVRVRYAPTIGIALHGLPEQAGPASTLAISGRLLAPRDGQRMKELEAQLLAAVPDSKLLPPNPPDASRFLRGVAKQIWVTDLVDVDPAAPLTASPFGSAFKTSDDSLASWLGLPVSGPELLLLPGVRCDAERSAGRRASGEDMFALVCGLHAAGCPAVLLSRWPVGGESTAELLQAMLKEVPHTRPSQAWQYAVLSLMKKELDPRGEPILSVGDQGAVPVPGSQPLFWSGYLLIDNRRSQ
jgi:hypothetical protein